MTTPDTRPDGWQEWHGGECPVPFDTPVEVRHRSGEESGSYMACYGNDARAGCWGWLHCGDPGDIVAYRLLPAPPKGSESNG